MSRRTRAIGFGLLAVLCAVASASIASGYRESVDEQLGELHEVVVVTETLPAGAPLPRRVLAETLELRQIPVRFSPPDVLVDPTAAVGLRPHAPIPAGSYLLASHLRSPGSESRARAPRLRENLQPVEIAVSAAGALAAAGGASAVRVDVVVASEPVTGGRARVRVAAEDVRLIALEPAAPEDATAAGGDSWSATLALDRSAALELIEAENFAREIRLIPSS